MGKSSKDDIADCPQRFNACDRKSIKSAGGSGGRRSSSSLAPTSANSGPVSGSQSLGSNYASAASGSSSGGTKRSLHSGRLS